MGCQEEMQKHFDWASKSGNKEVYPVVATMTIHDPADAGPKPDERHKDTVFYADGEVFAVSEDGEEMMKGVLHARLNAPAGNPFTPGPVSFEAKIFLDGRISLLMLMNGRKFMGRGPLEFETTCTGDLMHGIITGPFGGEAMFSLSLVRRPRWLNI